MFVENRTTSVITQGFYVLGPDGKHTTKIKNVTMLPGISEISDEDWERVKAHKTIQHRIDEEELIERDSKPLFKRPEKEALRLVKQTVDSKLLAAWQKEDSRETVKKAILTQLDSLKITDEDRKKAEEE